MFRFVIYVILVHAYQTKLSKITAYFKAFTVVVPTLSYVMQSHIINLKHNPCKVCIQSRKCPFFTEQTIYANFYLILITLYHLPQFCACLIYTILAFDLHLLNKFYLIVLQDTFKTLKYNFRLTVRFYTGSPLNSMFKAR